MSALKIGSFDFNDVGSFRNTIEEIIAIGIGYIRGQNGCAGAVKEIDGHTGDTVFTGINQTVVIRIEPDAVAEADQRHKSEVNSQVAIVIIRAAMSGSTEMFALRFGIDI